MVVTNMKLFCQYREATSFLSAEVRHDLNRLDVKRKVRHSNFKEAWENVNHIYLKLRNDSNSTSLDRRRINLLRSALYEHLTKTN